MASASSDARSDIEALDLRTSDRVKQLRAELRDPAALGVKIEQARLEGIWDALYALASRIDAEAARTD